MTFSASQDVFDKWFEAQDWWKYESAKEALLDTFLDLVVQGVEPERAIEAMNVIIGVVEEEFGS